MHIPFSLSLDFLWGENIFEKSEWGEINYIVGANGTGKSIFVERLMPILNKNSLRVRYLSSDRLADFTKQKYFAYANSPLSRGINLEWELEIKGSSSQRGESLEAFVLLRNNLDIRIKVESILSQLLNRTIILEEKGGFMIPKVILGDSTPYSFKEDESNGLKQIITLITLLLDDTYNCIIIDEPESNLHPQFQTFLMQQIRSLAGDPSVDASKKLFFIVTHSPYFIDVRTIDDLKNTIIFQPDKLPKYISKLESEDEYKLNSLLPRLNTHHKQFFFSSKPIFVEGNTDQQIFSLIQERRGRFVGSAGSSFIDVNGKDELDLFFRLCKQLDIDCRIIVDLDMIVNGKLRQSVSADERCREFLHSEGTSFDFFNGLDEVWKKLDELVSEFKKIFPTMENPSISITQLYETLSGKEKVDCRYPLLLAILREEITSTIIPNLNENISFILGRIKQIIDASKKSNVYILTKGELENYFSGIENHYNLTRTAKTNSFLIERDYLILNNPTETELISRYGELIEILNDVAPEVIVDYKQNLLMHVQDFVYAIQKLCSRTKNLDIEKLESNKDINYDRYKTILELINFEQTDDSFKCEIKIINFGIELEKSLNFDNHILPTDITI